MLVIKYLERIVLLVSLLFVVGIGTSFAQENPEELAKKYSISFPIAELGSCTSFSSCKAYCNNEANRETCMSYAKKKGFYQEVKRPDDAMMKSARETLGCDSESTCRAICEKEENFEKCRSFASKHGLSGPQSGGPGNPQILQKAKEILGCDSEATCRSICENPENQQKCSEFAKQTGLGGGERRVGPGGCNSEESCRSYCETHKEECMKFGGGSGPQGADAGRKGPGGCNSEESCKAYCMTHQEECRGFGGDAPPEEVEKFCRENPEKCAQGRNGPSNMNPEDFCRQNPEKCQRPPEGNYDQFRKDESFQRPQEEYQRDYQTPPQRSFQEPDATTGEAREVPVGYTTPDSSIKEESVRGASTQKSLFNRILDFIF